MESVVALTSEEEERRGVAASLLAPLIPDEVKEAEERWRKRVIAVEGKTEATDGDDGTHPSGSPALKDSDNASGSNQPSRGQSPDNSEAEMDTIELELALERKKVSPMFSHGPAVTWGRNGRHECIRSVAARAGLWGLMAVDNMLGYVLLEPSYELG